MAVGISVARLRDSLERHPGLAGLDTLVDDLMRFEGTADDSRRFAILWHLGRGRFTEDWDDLRALWDRAMAAGDYLTANRVSVEILLRKFEARGRKRPALRLVS